MLKASSSPKILFMGKDFFFFPRNISFVDFILEKQNIFHLAKRNY